MTCLPLAARSPQRRDSSSRTGSIWFAWFVKSKLCLLAFIVLALAYYQFLLFPWLHRGPPLGPWTLESCWSLDLLSHCHSAQPADGNYTNTLIPIICNTQTETFDNLRVCSQCVSHGRSPVKLICLQKIQKDKAYCFFQIYYLRDCFGVYNQ